MGGENPVGPKIQGSGWDYTPIDSELVCSTPGNQVTPAAELCANSSSQFCQEPKEDKKLTAAPVSLYHSLFTPARPPVLEMTLTPGAEADQLVLEVKIENALADFSNQSIDPRSRDGIIQASLVQLQEDLNRSHPSRFPELQNRLNKITAVAKLWDDCEKLKAAKPEVYVPWQEGANRLTEVQQVFATALISGDAKTLDQGLTLGNELMQDLRMMLAMDGARKVLVAASDPNVGSGQVRLLPEYTEASGDFNSPLSTVSLEVLNSSALVKTYQALKKRDPEEAKRVAAAIDYIRQHQEAGLLQSHRAAVVREEVYGHLLTLQNFVTLMGQPTYRVDDELRRDLVDPAVQRMQRYEAWLQNLATAPGLEAVRGNEGELAATLHLELEATKTKLKGLRPWGGQSKFVTAIRTGWLGEAADTLDEATKYLDRFFAESLGERLEAHELPTAQREATYDWDDAPHGAEDYEKQGGAPYPESGGIPLVQEKLRQVAAGELRGEEATRVIRDALVMLHETEQHTLVMELARREDQSQSVAELRQAIIRINTAGERTGQAADEIAKIARGEPVPLPISTLGRSELEQELNVLTRELPNVRGEIREGMTGWNFGEGDVHVSPVSVDLMIQEVDQLRSDLARATSDEEILSIKTRYTHLNQTLFQTVQARLDTTHKLHFYRDLLYEGLITTPIALTGALAGRVLIQAAIEGTALEGTVLGGSLVLGGEAGGMMLTSKLFQGAYRQELGFEKPLPYDSVPENVIHLVEELGRTTLMLGFFHGAQKLVEPFVARTEIALAMRNLAARGLSEMEILATREGQALLIDTIKTNLFGKLAATVIRMETTFGTFTAWDYLNANYESLKKGELHPLEAAAQVLSPMACLKRAALLPVYELYGRLTSPLSELAAQGKLQAVFDRNPELKAQAEQLSATLRRAQSDFTNFRDKALTGDYDPTELVRVMSQLKTAYHAKLDFESKLPTGMQSPLQRQLSERTLGEVERAEQGIVEAQGFFGEGNRFGIETDGAGHVFYPEGMESAIAAALTRSGAKVKLHPEQGVIEINGVLFLTRQENPSAEPEPTRPGGGPRPVLVATRPGGRIGAPPKPAQPTPTGIPIGTFDFDREPGVAKVSNTSPDSDPVGAADHYVDIYLGASTHHERLLLDHYCKARNRNALAFRDKLTDEYAPLVQRYHELRSSGDPADRPEMEAVAKRVIELYYELEGSPFQKNIVERYYARLKEAAVDLTGVTSVLTALEVRSARSHEPITYEVHHGSSLEGPMSDFVRIDVHVHSPAQAERVLGEIEGRNSFFDQMGDPSRPTKGQGLLIDHNKLNGSPRPGDHQLVVLACRIPKGYRAMPSPATQRLFDTFRQRVKEQLGNHPAYPDLARRVEFLDALQQDASPLVKTEVVDLLHEVLQSMAKSNDPETLSHEMKRSLDQAIAQYGATNGMVSPVSLTIHVDPAAEPAIQPATLGVGRP